MKAPPARVTRLSRLASSRLQREARGLRRAPATLATQVLVLFLLATLIPLGLLVYETREETRVARSHAVRDARSRSQMVASEVQATVQRGMSIAEALARLPGFWDGTDQMRDNLLTAFETTEPALDALIFLDAALQEHGRSNRPPGAPRLDLSLRDYAREAAATGQMAVTSQAIVAATDGSIVLPIAIPIHDPRPGGQAGFLVVGLSLVKLPVIWDEVPLPQGAAITLVDLREGRILAGDSTTGQRVNSAILPSSLARIRAGEGTFLVTLPSGADVLRAWSPVAQTPWIVAVDIPTRAIFEPVRERALQRAIARGIVVVVGLVALLVLWRRVLTRLRALKLASTHWARGAWSHRVGMAGSDELSQLGTAFDRMASQMEHAAARLAEHEAERDRALLRREALLRVARQFAAQTHREALLRELLAAAVQLLGADDAGLARWDAQSRLLVQIRSFLPSEHNGEVLDLNHSACGRAVTERRTVVVHDYQRVVGPLTPGGRAGAEAGVAAPIIHEERVLGALSVSTFDPARRFTDEDTESLELLVALAVAALTGLEQARLEGVLLAVRTIEHEMNNKLALTRGYAELLAVSPALPVHLREAAQEALRGADEAARLVEKLQQLTGLEERQWGALGGTTIDLGESSSAPADGQSLRLSA